MIGAFEFEQDGRTYRCSVHPARNPEDQPWWWFVVSGDTNRYAPFKAAPRDTRESVKSRIVAYYSNHLERRFAPAQTQSHWSRRGKPAQPQPGK